MIISRLSFQNILTYYGNQTLELPTQGDRTLTVIVGPNNSGKTSIIRALKFWFYGESGVPKKNDLHQYLSNKAKAETPVGKTAQAWVEVSFERSSAQGKETHHLRRTIEAKRVTEERWEVVDVRLQRVGGGAKPALHDDEGSRYQRMIESMVPRALFDAFYFKGEPLDGKLLGDVTSIRQALGQFLHEDQWKEAEQAVARVRDGLAKKLSKMSEANSDLTRKLTEERQNQLKLTEQLAALAEEQSALAKAEAQLAEATDQLERLGDHEAGQHLNQALTTAKNRLKLAQDRFASIDQELLTEVNQSLGLPFLLGAIDPVSVILAEMEKDNILPADITPGFVDRVLAKKDCICGKKHDEDSRSNWEAYRKKTLATDAGEGLRKLLDWVKPTGPQSVKQRSEKITEALARLTDQRSQAVAEISEAQAAVNDAHRAVENVPLEAMAKLGRALRELQSEIKSRSNRTKIISDSVASTEYYGKKIKDDIQALSAKSGVDQNAFKRLSLAKDRAERLLRTLGACRQRLGHYFHGVLQASVADFYDSKSTDGSKARIDRQTLLPSIEVKGQKTNNLGGGQSQLLALAYVVSLARLRQDMHAQMEKLGVRLGKIDDLSFFMDSPFGNMESHYKNAAIDLVPGAARQVLLLLWKEEWDFAREHIEELADRVYAVQFSTTPEDWKKIGKDLRIYAFATGKQELIQALPKGDDQPRSELLKIQ